MFKSLNGHGRSSGAWSVMRGGVGVWSFISNSSDTGHLRVPLLFNYELSTLFRHFSSVPREFISDDRVSAFVREKTGIDPGPHTTLGIFQGGKVTVGFLFNHYTGQDIGLTLAIAHPRALTKEFLRRCGAYCFKELRVSRVTMFTEQPAVVSIARRCGAEIEGVKRDAFGPGRNAIMLGLLARDWKFK